ncbi:hypothetical protein [Herbiconiux sp.]|uniref:hypothetical protein n=1 Tax=Herbiconiux sp. TaxID=1871186 RepID=UPI0025B8CA52|nr:hypothetical protein [Herbiconiux sp.]
MREAFEDWNPKPEALEQVRIANAICAEMKAQGYDLTLRQLYYQFVARDYIPNTMRSYKNLGAVMNRARLAGLMDWDYLEDRTRNLRGSHGGFETPAELIELNKWQYETDHWLGQDYRVEIWVEKDALVSVVGRAAGRYSAPYFSCRGYVSQSELYAAAQRHLELEQSETESGLRPQVIVIHLGDHDPSGIDMTRDMQDRLRLFGASTEVVRIALNRDQIDQYNPPPNPAKITDSRARGYIAEHGRSSWELDALEPQVLNDLIGNTIQDYLDRDLFEEQQELTRGGRQLLEKTSEQWAAVTELLDTL